MSTKNSVAYLLMMNVSPETWMAPLHAAPQVLGRLLECDIVIPDRFRHVSRKHALIGFERGNLWIQDLGSSGGTILNGVPLLPNRQALLAVGDRLSLAGLDLYVVSAEASIVKRITGAPAKPSQLSGTVRITGRQSNLSSPDDRLRSLSPAELEVIRWISRGIISSQQIGQKLFRSPNTIRTHIGNIFEKLGVHSKEDLLVVLKKADTAWTKSTELEGSMSRTDDSIIAISEFDLESKSRNGSRTISR